jgi:hypothetical protein
VDKEIIANGYTVRLRLYAGFVELSDEGANTDDPDKFSGGSLAGWYLICNGRMLLSPTSPASRSTRPCSVSLRFASK